MGPAEKPLSRRMRRGVSHSEATASATMTSSRHGACRRATASTTPTSHDRVEPSVHAQRLDAGAVATEGGERLTRELHRVEDEEGRRGAPPSIRPHCGPEPERPGERHAGQVAEEQRRIAQRRQHAADVGHDEDEEDDGVLDVRALAVGLQERPDEQHGGARGPHEGRQEPAERQEPGVGGGRRHQVASQQDAAGDHEQAGEQDDERDVVDGRVQEAGRMAQPVEGEHGEAQDRGGEQLVAVRLPPVRDPERAHGDGQQHGRQTAARCRAAARSRGHPRSSASHLALTSSTDAAVLDELREGPERRGQHAAPPGARRSASPGPPSPPHCRDRC